MSLEFIISRRSAKKLDPEKIPPKETIEKIIEAGTWAPTHHLTEPWRFVVIAGEERKKLGDALARGLDESDLAKLDAERKKPLRVPVIIALISTPKQEPNVIPQEEMVSCGAALQNMLLAIHSMSLGSMIKTGKSSYSHPVREYFEMSENETLVAMIYVGYPVEASPAGKRSTFSSKTEWRGM